MDPVFIPLLIEVVKFGGWILNTCRPKPNSTVYVHIPQPPTTVEHHHHATVVHQYVLNTNFLEHAIGRTNAHLSQLIEATAHHIRNEMRRQRIHQAIDDVMANAEVLGTLLPLLQRVELERARQLITPTLQPLHASIGRARRVLQREGEEESWRLCNIIGTSVLLSGYVFINQDMPPLRQSVEQTMREIQEQMLNEIIPRHIAIGQPIARERIGYLLTPNGIDELAQLYLPSLPPTTQPTPPPRRNRCDPGFGYDPKKYDRQIEVYTRAIQLSPNYATAYYDRGVAHYRKGEYDLAIADYTTAIRLDPNNAWAYYNRGIAYRKKGEYDLAIADCTTAIRLDPNDAKAYNNRGYTYIKKGEYDRAIMDCNEAIRLEPNGAFWYDTRGYAYEKSGQYRLALADYARALELNPNLQAAQNGYRRVLAKMSR